MAFEKLLLRILLRLLLSSSISCHWLLEAAVSSTFYHPRTPALTFIADILASEVQIRSHCDAIEIDRSVSFRSIVSKRSPPYIFMASKESFFLVSNYIGLEDE